MAPIYLVSLALFLICAALSFWRGGGWERTMAVIVGVAWVITTFAPFNKEDPAWPVVAIDGFTTLFALYGAVFSGRKWMLWAAAFQLLLMGTHLAFARSDDIQQWAYVTALYLWSDLGLLALAVGAVTRKHGVNTPASPQDDSDARR